MLEGIILDRVDSFTNLGVVMDSRMSFSRHIDVTVEKALAMLGFVKRLSGEFRDPYSLRTLNVSLVRPKFEYASCVWRPFNDMHISRIEHVQRSSYDPRCEDWDERTCMIFLNTWSDVH
jgi:hypothetical protein